MKGEHRKMRVLMGAVIARAQEIGLWDGQNGAWDVPRAVRLYDGVNHFFKYPTTIIRRNEQISWRTVYNKESFNKKGRTWAWSAQMVARRG